MNELKLGRLRKADMARHRINDRLYLVEQMEAIESANQLIKNTQLTKYVTDNLPYMKDEIVKTMPESFLMRKAVYEYSQFTKNH